MISGNPFGVWPIRWSLFMISMTWTVVDLARGILDRVKHDILVIS